MLLEDWDTRQRSRRGKDKNASAPQTIVAVAVIVAVIAGFATISAVKAHSRHTLALSATKLHKVKLAVTAPAAAPKSWRLTFSSAFSGTQLDSQVWATCYPWAPKGCTNYGNTHDPDMEWYQPSQVQVSGGLLHLTAQRAPTQGVDQAGAAKQYACRSGMLSSFPGLKFTYGFIDVVAKIPFGSGLWPAIWLASADQKWPPEIDLLEHWGTETQGKIYFHPLGAPREGGAVKMPKLGTGWHSFALSWTKTRLTWYYDGQRLFTSTNHVPQQAMYFIANVADDKVGSGSCSGSMLIKSVRVWQPPA